MSDDLIANSALATAVVALAAVVKQVVSARKNGVHKSCKEVKRAMAEIEELKKEMEETRKGDAERDKALERVEAILDETKDHSKHTRGQVDQLVMHLLGQNQRHPMTPQG